MAVFEKLLEYRRCNDRIPIEEEAILRQQFASATAEIEEFIQAATKDAKVRWMKKHGIELPPAALGDIGLPTEDELRRHEARPSAFDRR